LPNFAAHSKPSDAFVTTALTMAAIQWHVVSGQLLLPAAAGAATQMPKLAWLKLPAAFSSLSSWQELLESSTWLMGRRDKRTCKGKVFKGSSGDVSHTQSICFN